MFLEFQLLERVRLRGQYAVQVCAQALHGQLLLREFVFLYVQVRLVHEVRQEPLSPSQKVSPLQLFSMGKF